MTSFPATIVTYFPLCFFEHEQHTDGLSLPQQCIATSQCPMLHTSVALTDRDAWTLALEAAPPARESLHAQKHACTKAVVQVKTAVAEAKLAMMQALQVSAQQLRCIQGLLVCETQCCVLQGSEQQ